MLIYLVAGARPNFMKIAPIVRALQARPDAPAFKIIHTGQHYDREMNDVFFEELGIPQPDVFMAAGGGSHAQQTAKIMIGFEELCTATRASDRVTTTSTSDRHGCAISGCCSVQEAWQVADPIADPWNGPACHRVPNFDHQAVE